MHSNSISLISLQDLAQALSLSTTSIYRFLDQTSKHYDPTFPKPFKLTPKTVRWSLEQVELWLEKKQSCKAEEGSANLTD
ncbi:AlpA family phage regulatory protein [Thiomicrorhabdus sp. 6S2-11]|uniref:AlpA family phage regulatory protein n=1 Tax=Thiomicrorhabdus marina TaxID=2818442 RepID=A0ABS3Q3A2_9GAMM|nr:AlpA family phage regulatory protein [Thiomicrorhabdus marina]MBO1926628.1 AlpA family phage regulatory protein [Thiomicrorhabdus marina]